MYYVYVLYSFRIDRFYTGHCQDTGDRFIRHNQGRSKSTKTGVPWVMVHSEAFDTRSKAIHRERQIKAMKSRAYLVKITGFDPRTMTAFSSID